MDSARTCCARRSRRKRILANLLSQGPSTAAAGLAAALGNYPSWRGNDRTMMARCLELATRAIEEGEHPFGSVIVRNGAIVWLLFGS
jgi:hypothetical protein